LTQGVIVPPAMYLNNPVPQYTANPQAQQFHLYGLPPSYTPPVATCQQGNPTPINLQAQQFPLYSLSLGYNTPVATNHQSHISPTSSSNPPNLSQLQEHNLTAVENPQL